VNLCLCLDLCSLCWSSCVPRCSSSESLPQVENLTFDSFYSLLIMGVMIDQGYCVVREDVSYGFLVVTQS
jgi:hypothetical protein